LVAVVELDLDFFAAATAIQSQARLFAAACVDSVARSQPLQQGLDDDFIVDEAEKITPRSAFATKAKVYGSPHS